MLSYILVLLSALIVSATAAVHHLFVGNLSPPFSIHALEFDDQAVTLKKTKTLPAAGTHPWITFDRTKSNVYGASFSNASVASYSVLDHSTLRLDASINSTDNCDNRTAAYVQSSSHPPYHVYTGSWPGPQACGQALSTYRNGTLKEVIQTWTYKNDSGIHGLALGPGDRILYSADLNGDAVWAHGAGTRWGGDDRAMAVKGMFNMPKKGKHPRHLVAHPNGEVLHVVMEAGNEIVELEVDRRGVPVKETGTWSLIPPTTKNTSDYWSAEVKYSHNHRYLWATARARQNSTNTGFITVFALGRDGRVEDPLARVPTTTTGGIANAVAPAPWGDEWVAMADVPKGYVQIWKLGRTNEENHGNELARKEDRLGKKWNGTFTATAVARVDIADGGCCANIIWYD
ncbi:uncharacterized protein BP5553_04187 [Venustampulla echinocandica]|uniref:3-carboxy-cis,cis-mucoante lactonizing enzyme n=1 Tax=Venustampulla echinocandica TaxID=2656787 RepID=A0A370TWE9_9HELO|nr:uncharacterized protein BP5553_04187 [Venustampulla echinocandica]RDL39847.1 hypothetical protein BP5553_04187 [Venustampulla echinocandica]